MSITRFTTCITLALLTAAVACTERRLLDDDEAAPDDLDPGDQPLTPGAMYSPCKDSSECPDGLCVFPRDEAGYCSAPCDAPTDPGRCDPPPGDQPAACLDIGLPSGSWVCALDCDDAACPRGMRCEQVMASDGRRSICF